MASISFLTKYTMLALIFVMVTGAISKVFDSTSNCANASLPAAMTAYAKASHTLSISPTNISSTFITSTTRHASSVLSPAADLYISLNMTQEQAEPYTCERAEREAVDIRARKCGSLWDFRHLKCWGGSPFNCCVDGKGPANCLCHMYWPEDAPRGLKTGQGLPGGTFCFVHG